jgi:hypothetical protein
MTDILGLRRRAADRLKWDKATLHQKMGETIDLIEAMRVRMDRDEAVPADEVRVLLNELTRRTALLDLCRSKHPTEKHRIHITLSIADSWISKFALIIKAKQTPPGSSTRSIIEQGFKFLPDRTRAAMLKSFDEGREQVAQAAQERRREVSQKGGTSSQESKGNSKRKSDNSTTT